MDGWTYVCMYICIHVHVHGYVCVCMCVCIYMDNSAFSVLVLENTLFVLYILILSYKRVLISEIAYLSVTTISFY